MMPRSLVGLATPQGTNNTPSFLADIIDELFWAIRLRGLQFPVTPNGKLLVADSS